MSKDLKYAGQYIIDSLDIIQSNGVSLDVKAQMLQLTIYEDMFSPFMSGNVIMQDTMDIPNLLLNGGIDVLRVRVYTPGLPEKFVIEQFFHIYKISDRAEIGDRMLSYIIHFTSVDMLTDSKKTISKTYKDKPQDIIKSIIEDELESDKKFDFDTATNSIQYTSNFWNASKNINYAVSHAKGEDGFPSFVFFENRFGYQFRQLTKFANKEYPVMQSFGTTDYSADITDKGAESGVVTRDLDKDYQNVLSVLQPLYYDYYKDRDNGMFNSRLHYYDLVNKKIKDVTFDMTLDSHDRLNDNQFYKDSTILASFEDKGNVMMHGETHYALYNGAIDVTDAKFKQQRISMMRQFQQHMLRLDVLGRTDYTVGTKIYMNANKMRRFEKGSSPNDIRDNYITGYFIVSALCHRFSRDNKHVCSMEVISDSISKGK